MPHVKAPVISRFHGRDMFSPFFICSPSGWFRWLEVDKATLLQG
jgi:hypothetical protein